MRLVTTPLWREDCASEKMHKTINMITHDIRIIGILSTLFLFLKVACFGWKHATFIFSIII